jgi:hypothetical protein
VGRAGGQKGLSKEAGRGGVEGAQSALDAEKIRLAET